MNSHVMPATFRTPRAVLVLAMLLIALGLFFRFYHADYKALSDDEAVTMMHVLGVTDAEAVRSSVGFRHVADLQAMIHPSAVTRSVSTTVDALRVEDPQHPPIYYVIAHYWIQTFGNSRNSVRILSAVIGVLALPCMFWLGMELFRSSRAAWIGTALLAVSPVAVLYSQEMREYSLWLVALLLTSALFFRALRNQWRWHWMVYALAFGVSLYVYPASAFIGLAHALVAATATLPWRNRLYAWAAILAGCLLFSPWLLIIAASIHQISRGMAYINTWPTTPTGVLTTFVALLRLDVLDLNDTHERFKQIATIPIVGFIVYALYALYSRRRSGLGVAWQFVWTILLCTTLPFVLPDLISGGARTATTRYFIPLFVATDVAIAALICAALDRPAARPVARQMWVACFALIFASRIFSCVVSAQTQTWWTKYNIHSLQVAVVVNNSPRPIIIGDTSIEWLLALGEYLDPKIDVALNLHCYLCESQAVGRVDLTPLSDPNEVRALFLLSPSPQLRSDVNAKLMTASWLMPSRCIHIRDNCVDGLSLY